MFVRVLPRWFTPTLFAGAAFAIAGCNCDASICKPAIYPSSNITRPVVLQTTTPEAIEQATAAAAPLIDPAGLTVAEVMGELQVMIDKLTTLTTNLGGELRSVAETTQAAAQNVIADLGEQLGDKLEFTYNQLNQSQQLLFNDAVRLAITMQSATQRLEEGAAQDAKITLWDADIIAYNAEQNIPCAKQIPRLVYASPLQFRVWKDVEMPSDPDLSTPEDRRQLIVAVRGNFLDRGNDFTARVNGRTAQVLGRGPFEFRVVVPDEVVKELQQLQSPGTLTISANPSPCDPLRGHGLKPGAFQDVFVTVLPPLSYEVAVRISPLAKVPSFKSFPFSFRHTSDDCAEVHPITKNYSIRPYVVIDWDLTITNRGCKQRSRVEAVRLSGAYAVIVDGHYEACGRGPCVFGNCICQGRGDLGYKIVINGKDYAWKSLTTSEQTRVGPGPFVFPYWPGVPADRQDLACEYYARIVIDEGGIKRIVELSRTNSSDADTHIQSSYDPLTCAVTVTLPPQIKLWAM